MKKFLAATLAVLVGLLVIMPSTAADNDKAIIQSLMIGNQVLLEQNAELKSKLQEVYTAYINEAGKVKNCPGTWEQSKPLPPIGGPLEP